MYITLFKNLNVNLEGMGLVLDQVGQLYQCSGVILCCPLAIIMYCEVCCCLHININCLETFEHMSPL